MLGCHFISVKAIFAGITRSFMSNVLGLLSGVKRCRWRAVSGNLVGSFRISGLLSRQYEAINRDGGGKKECASRGMCSALQTFSRIFLFQAESTTRRFSVLGGFNKVDVEPILFVTSSSFCGGKIVERGMTGMILRLQ